MRHSDRVEMLAFASKACRDEAAQLDKEYDALIARVDVLSQTHPPAYRDEADKIELDRKALLVRVENLQKRIDRLDVEANRLLREYGLDPNNLPVVRSDA